jgi:hypothetical protein
LFRGQVTVHRVVAILSAAKNLAGVAVLGVGQQTRQFPISGDRLASQETAVAQPEAGRAWFLSDPEPDGDRFWETNFQGTKRAV